jgi:hypothetical protein
MAMVFRRGVQSFMVGRQWWNFHRRDPNNPLLLLFPPLKNPAVGVIDTVQPPELLS